MGSRAVTGGQTIDRCPSSPSGNTLNRYLSIYLLYMFKKSCTTTWSSSAVAEDLSAAWDLGEGFRIGPWSTALRMEYTTRPKMCSVASTGPKALLSGGRVVSESPAS